MTRSNWKGACHLERGVSSCHTRPLTTDKTTRTTLACLAMLELPYWALDGKLNMPQLCIAFGMAELGFSIE